jgi:hypothetical protein
MNKLTMVLFMVIGLILFLGTYFYNLMGWIAVFLILFAINGLLNGLNYYNRSYFLINLILIAIFPLIFYYYSLEITYKYFGWVIYGLIFFGLIYQFKNRKNNPIKPWKDEW